MMRHLALWAFVLPAAFAQPRTPADLLSQMNELEAVIRSGDWPKAAEISARLRNSVRSARDASLAAASSATLNSILGYLPADTHTLLVSQQPFRLEKEDRTQVRSAPQMAHGYGFGLLGAANKGAMIKQLQGRTMTLGVLAAREFGQRSPEDEPANNEEANRGVLGMIPFQACGFYLAAQPYIEADLDAGTEESIFGRRSWRSKGSMNDEPDSTTFYTTLLQPQLLLVCNSRKFFEQVLVRSSEGIDARNPFAGLAEWNAIDRSAPVWMFCRRPLVEMMKELSTNVGALIAEFGSDQTRVRARVRSDVNLWQTLLASPDFGGQGISRELEKGIWEIQVGPDARAEHYGVFLLMALAGFVILI